MPRDPDCKLCGAPLDTSVEGLDRIRARAIAWGKDPDAAVRRRLRHGGFCSRPAMPWSDRCSWHGALSGPATDAGKAKVLAGRTKWLARLKANGKPVPFGRKPGGKNRPKDVIEAEKLDRAMRRGERRSWIERSARTRAQGQEMAEYEKRREAFHNGRPFWSDAEPARVAVATAVDLAIAAIEQSRATGLPPDRTDILDLERCFIGRLQVGDLPTQVAERIYNLLEREEQRLDQGDRADLKRRARLEEAYEGFLASRRTVPPTNRLPAAENQPLAPCPPPVDNSADNDANPDTDRGIEAEIDGLLERMATLRLAPSAQQILDAELIRAGDAAARLVVLRKWIEGATRAHEIARTRAGHHGRATPAPPDRPFHSIAPWLRRRPG